MIRILFILCALISYAYAYIYYASLHDLFVAASHIHYNETRMLQHYTKGYHYITNITYFELNSSLTISHEDSSVRLTFINDMNTTDIQSNECNHTILHQDIEAVCLQPYDHQNIRYFKQVLSYYIQYMSNMYPTYSFSILSTGGNGNLLSQLLSIHIQKTYGLSTKYLYLFNLQEHHKLHIELQLYLADSVTYGYHIITEKNISKVNYLANICLECE